jgi:DNA-binding transcriptional LysR family regulator
MADRLLGMEVFAKTAETGSFAAAAAALGMSAQMAGKHVSALEKRLGARLLNRSTHRHSLTEAGRLFLDGCQRTLAQAHAAESSVVVRGGAPRGTLRIAAPLGFGSDGLVPELTAFLTHYPELRIELALADKVTHLIEEGYDAAIRIGHLPDSALLARTLAPYRMVTCGAPDYLARRGVPTTPEHLHDHECMDYRFAQHPASRLWRFAAASGTVEIDSRARFVVNDGRALIEAALAGFGLIQVGEMKVRALLASGRLVRLLADFECAPRPLQIVFASRRLQAPKVRALIDWLGQSFAAPG